MAPLSERNTSKPFFLAKYAAPHPLSPPPKTTIFIILFDLMIKKFKLFENAKRLNFSIF